MIKHVWAVYFSPSGKTEQVTMAVAEGASRGAEEWRDSCV